MTDEAMSPLRGRMIEDMTIRKLAPKSQQGYIRAILRGERDRVETEPIGFETKTTETAFSVSLR
jgi:hypothetical protein